MRLQTLVLETPLAVLYEQIYQQSATSAKTTEELIEQYRPMTILSDPKQWFEGLVIMELALEKVQDTQKVQDYFEWLFKGFDCNASFDLNDTDYDWFWNKIHSLFDRAALRFPDALVEKALQYFSARRGYVDKKKTLQYLEEAIEKGSDTAITILGYYYYFGFCGITDKEKGMQMMDSVKTEQGKGRTTIYKGYIAIFENRYDEAGQIISELEQQTSDPFLLRMAKEQKAFISDLQDKPEEAATLYTETLGIVPSGFVMLRMGFLHYNRRIEGADPEKGLLYMEQALRYGRLEAIRSLYYCYSESGEAWQNEEKGLYFIRKGYEYNDEYSTYQLAWSYLYNETYKDTAKGLALLDEAIGMKYIDAYITKAYILFSGELLEKDIETAVGLLEEAEALGSGNAAYRLGYLYDSGELSSDNEPDYAKALPYFEKAAELNEAYACEYAGKYYLYGLGVEEDTQKALYYYEKGRSLGSPYCIVELAIMYDDGNGVEANPVKSFELLKEAVEHNYAYGQYLLGRCYRYGMGTDEDPDKAVEYFQLATDQGNVRAMAELALCYEYGEGVEANGSKALEYMKAAAEGGYTYAEYKTGCYYLYGLEGVPTDYPEAFKWLSLAAESDYPHALLELGDFYLYDYEGKEEYEKAYSFYERAARQEVVNEGLGVCLEYGYGTEINEGEAFKYYLKAAEDGYIRGMNYTALCYYYGTGVKENYPEAYRWFNDAANQGHITATYFKGKMLLDGEGCSQDITEGIQCVQSAAENDESRAQYLLGNCYLTGKGVEENADLAMEWFEKAAENGHEKALKITGRRRRR